MADGNFPVDEVVQAVKAEVKDHYTKLDKKTEDLAVVIDGLKAGLVDKVTLEGHLKDLRAELEKLAKGADELDKKLQRPGRGAGSEEKSVGQTVIESDQWKALVANRGGKSGRIELKTITNAGTIATGQSLQVLSPRQRIPGIITPPEVPLMIRDLIPSGRTSTNALEWVRESGFTNSAAPVAENTLKPESNLTFEMVNTPVRTIAHWIQASKQVLDDAPMLASYIDGRMTYGLKLKEEAQLLLGDGTGQNLTGIIPQAVAFVATGIPASPTIVDRIRWAKLQVRKAQYPASAVVLNPQDWALIELLKDATGSYLFSAFTSGAEPRLWGLRVVESDSVEAGNFLVGAFNLGAQVWDREDASVVVSTEDRDNLVKNMATILCEERLALTVHRPESFVHYDATP